MPDDRSNRRGAQIKPRERLSENVSSVTTQDAPRSQRFKIVVGGIIVLVVLVLITVVTDLITTGEVMKK